MYKFLKRDVLYSDFNNLHTFIFRSDQSGNCLYCSVSLALVWQQLADKYSSVLKRKLHTHYPDHGTEKSKATFSREIFPRGKVEYPLNPFHILYCFEGSSVKGLFRHNHYK